MNRLHCAWPRTVIGSAVVISVLALGCATAGAGLTITNTSADDLRRPSLIRAAVRTMAVFHFGTTGYIVDSTAPGLVAERRASTSSPIWVPETQ